MRWTPLLAGLLLAACVDPMPQIGDAPRPSPKPAVLTRVSTDEDVAHLREENARLRAENAQLRSMVAAPAAAQARPLATVETPPAAVDLNSSLLVTDAKARVTEANDVWRRFAWQMTIKNTGQRGLSFELQVEFTDREGFTIDRGSEGRVEIPAGSERSFSGDKLVTMPGALNVTGIRAKAG